MNKFVKKNNSTSKRREPKHSPRLAANFGIGNLTIEQRHLFLVPLVQVAWGHGIVSTREKHLIYKAAREDGIDERHPLNDTLGDLLINQPSRRFFDDCLEQLSEILFRMTVSERGRNRSKLISRCTQVAEVTGDERFDTDGGISDEERQSLAYIISGLEYRPPKAAADAFG